MNEPLSVDRITTVLSNASLRGFSVAAVPARVRGGHDEVDSFANVSMPSGTTFDIAYGAWKVLREALPETGAWPVLLPIEMLHLDRQTGDRYQPIEVAMDALADIERTRPRMAPHEVDTALGERYADTWLALMEDPPRIAEDSLFAPEALERKVLYLREHLGRAPSAAEVAGATGPDGEPIRHLEVADWWIHRWSLANIEQSRLVEFWSRYQPSWVDIGTGFDQRSVLLLPLGRPESVAALGTFRIDEDIEAQLVWARLLHDWYDEWRAEPVTHAGTFVEFRVLEPPRSIEAALPLAVEHASMGPYVLDGPGLSVYEYAYTLVGASKWHIIDQP